MDGITDQVHSAVPGSHQHMRVGKCKCQSELLHVVINIFQRMHIQPCNSTVADHVGEGGPRLYDIVQQLEMHL